MANKDPQRPSLRAPIQILIADFQTTEAILQTIANATYQANQSEYETLQRLSSYKRIGEPFVKNQDIPLEEDKSLTYSSLNSHLQKAQSEQIKVSGLQTIKDLQQTANNSYINKKVTFKVLDKKLTPLHNCWLNKRSGEISYGQNKSNTVTGRISEINLSKNYVLIKPGMGRQFFSSALEAYLVEIINPSTGQPMVEATLAERQR